MANGRAKTEPGRLPGLASLLADQVGYQLRLLLRTPRAVIAGLAFPSLLLLLRSSSHTGSHVETATVAGLSVFGVITTSYLSHATGLVAAREAGVLKRWRATPLPAWCLFTGRILAIGVFSITSTAVTVLVGVTILSVKVSAGAVPSVLAAIAAGALAWAAVGTVATRLIPAPDSASVILSITYLPVALFSGALFGPPGSMPGWLSTLMRYLPAQPIVDAATRALGYTGSGLAPMPARDFAVLAAWAVAGLLASVYFFRWEPQRSTHGRPARHIGSAGERPASHASHADGAARERHASHASHASPTGGVDECLG
jgi:ABC-2 type transport system permease protein